MKKVILTTILSLAFTAQANFASAESASFNLSVTIPVMVQMSSDALQAPSAPSLAFATTKATQMVQEQQIVRGQETVTVRTIVAL
ncbi:MAG: hypothetical protein WCO69_03620 [Candidatus Omnitrophota bacterium]